MNFGLLNKYVFDILKKSGWYENREYDISFWTSELEEEGYHLNKYAKTVLEELGVYVREKSKVNM